MTVDQDDDSILLSYAEAEGSGRVVCCGAGVSCWHKADTLVSPTDVCFRGQSGHGPDGLECLLMTPSGHSEGLLGLRIGPRFGAALSVK